MIKFLSGTALCLVLFSGANPAIAQEAATYDYTLISQVDEANTRVTAIAIDFGRPLPLNWSLDKSFAVSAQLDPVESHTGEVLANSAAANAPRTITRAYTRATPDAGTPQSGQYVIIEMRPEDANASSYYVGYNPGFRQLLPYGEKMHYEIDLLNDLNIKAETDPGGQIETIPESAEFQLAGARIRTADSFTQGVFEQPENQDTKQIGYNLHVPQNLSPTQKVPLVVFLHGSGQSHDTTHFANDISADVKAPLLTNRGGVVWLEAQDEPAVVLVPQAPARDLIDAEGYFGWSTHDTQSLLIGLIRDTLRQHPEIDRNRLYLTGLSMGAYGSWKLLSNPDPEISGMFAAAALFSGMPHVPGRAPEGLKGNELRRWKAESVLTFPFENVTVPLWLGHGDTDPVVDPVGVRTAFSQLTGEAEVGMNFELVPEGRSIVSDDGDKLIVAGTNMNSGAEVRYTEHKFGEGSRFIDLGMATAHGHFTWEIDFLDQTMIDWLFAQRRGSQS